MKMDIRAEQGVIIGAFCTAIGLILILLESQDLWQNLYSENEYHSSYIKTNTIQLVLYVAATLFSILLIAGVLKRRFLLIAPWLIAAFAGATFVAYYGGMVLMFVSFDYLGFLVPLLSVAGIETLILYPLISLFREIWLENSEAKKQRIQDQLNFEKKMKSCLVDLNLKAVV